MKAISFNEGWSYRHLEEGEWKQISVPHDAQIFEPRVDGAPSGVNSGWFLGFDYEYQKTFSVPKDTEGKDVIIEFEGVYHNAEVYLNGEKVMFRPYGYTNFYVIANDYLKYGEDNVIRVIARNADQPNSRWYSGAGIYRPVNLFIVDKERFELNGVKIKTVSIDPAIIEVATKTTVDGEVTISIEKDGKVVATATGKDKFTIEVPNAELWNVDTPVLYTCRATFKGDEEVVSFGIRTLGCDAKNGMTINGERVILRGACIHHDNGILGAMCLPEAEERKIRILKENGYNAIRSAHNPLAKATLDVCDRLGMLVMDEYVDMWYVHKTMYDYALYLADWWKQDMLDMVDKDYNHPCVVLYSTGNEVGESSEEKGIKLAGEFTEYLHSLDDTRPVTCGINIWFNAMYSMGFGQYSDEKAKKAAEAPAGNAKKKEAVGSEFFNNLAGLVGADFMKIMATLPICDRVTKGSFANMDVAGYNYGIKRYKHDLKKYPNRVILGSETFCSDAYIFWEQAKENPALIGDFVWAGMDYLGEVGIGSWEYSDYAKNFNNDASWLCAGSGRIDLVGNPLGEALYTKVAFELEDKPQIAVVPVNHTHDKHSPSAWKFSNAFPSWSWNGCDGNDAKVEVYSRAARIDLYVNNKKVASKKFRKNCKFDFMIKYYAGTITAVAYDKDGKEISRNSLTTAGDETILTLTPEVKTAKMGELCFVNLTYTDEKGVWKPLERAKITVTVEGGELVSVGHACPNNPEGFLTNTTDTYFGRALAAVRATSNEVVITATDGVHTAKTIIEVK